MWASCKLLCKTFRGRDDHDEIAHDETSLMSGFVVEFTYDSMCSRLLLLNYGNCT